MFNPSFSAQALVAMKLIYSCCVEHGASSCALAKLSVRKMSSLPTFRPLADAFSSQHRKLRGSDNSPATAGAVGAHERGAQADPPHKNARSKTAHLAFRLRAPEIIGRSSCLFRRLGHGPEPARHL